MKTLRLDLDYEFDFDLYGVVSSSKEHTLAWALNKYFNLRLIKQKDLCFDFISKGRLVISNYLHATDHYSIRLFRNKSVDLSTLKKPFLVPDIKDYDYVIQVSGAVEKFRSGELLRKMNLVPLVQYVKQFDPNALQFKDNLIF
ncbi:IPExxxVDY family protein [Adhaeribacter soli]|uniref:IPExxxVDY family protein n=1 Tax=Adhaeribacter soli TaxID=2607655 RepID=A0A5N1IU95_9BACT|nr:IPExxxVDY family protein [Adhaeribacter soli]KAA9333590.1 IPExxxVDY family protein [Adhaeribacter soli]